MPDSDSEEPRQEAAERSSPPRTHGKTRAALGLVLLAAVASRALAALAAELYARQQRVLDLFGDTAVYWQLGRALSTGAEYVVSQWGVPHHAIRTPGYPAFLAICQILFGPENTLAPRLVQATLGGVTAWLLVRLTRSIAGPPAGEPMAGRTVSRFVPLAAAVLFAFEPYTVGMSALLLSEAVFFPLMVGGLWGLSSLWRGQPPGAGRFVTASTVLARGVATGAAFGAAVLVKPSWALYLPLSLTTWLIVRRSRSTLIACLIVGASASAVMAPWWVRNERVFHRFVPTALWVGASLYDGMNPSATGASDMRFLEDPDVRVMGEVEQDTELRRRAVAFARSDPGRVLELSAIKARRFFSPWPNADELSSPGLAWISALATLPLYLLLLRGLWDRRRDARALVLLAGPLLYFFGLHLLFVSSIRYRVPGMVPAFGLAAIGLARLLGRPVDGVVEVGPEGDRPGSRRIAMRRAITWALLMPLAVIAGGGWYAINYATDSNTLTELVREQSRRFLPDSIVLVRRGSLRPMVGELTLAQVRVDQGLPTLPHPTLEIGWLQVRCDLWAMLRGERRVRQVIVAQPTLRLARREDGRWNLEGLLADPWPAPPLHSLPKVRIEKGTVYLSTAEGNNGVLRDVTITLDPVAEVSQAFSFELSARGDGVDRIRLVGTFHMPTRRVEVSGGEVHGIDLSGAMRRRLPDEWRAAFDRLGLDGGLADVSLGHCLYDPTAGRPLQYDLEVRLHGGTLDLPELPFALNDVEMTVRARDGTAQVKLQANNGRTEVGARGEVSLDDPESGPFSLGIDVTHLELDERLRARTPDQFRDFWEQFRPKGRVDVYARVVRAAHSAPIGMGATVDFRDVALVCRDWPYPLEHVMGRLNWENGVIEVERLSTLIGNRPAACWGRIESPGPRAHVLLDFELGALPIDQKLFDSMPPDMLRTILDFRPAGSVRVRDGKLERFAPAPGEREGRVDLRATLDLGAPFSFTWVGLPYPVTDVSGQLVIGPGRWELKNLKGWNGLAEVEGNGWIETVGRSRNRFNADISIAARNLPFNEQLKRALPPEWGATWDVLNPTGSTGLDARVTVVDNAQRHLVTIVPEKDTQVRLRFVPIGSESEPARPLALPVMELDKGTFVYDEGLVRMDEVKFRFRGSPVEFTSGTVALEDNGRFELDVQNLRVANFQLDRELRQLLPPVAAEFARRIDDSPPLPVVEGDMKVGWSGVVGDPAWVSWQNGLVVFNGQTIRTGVPIESLQGRLYELNGRSDGRSIEVSGILDLESAHMLGQQVNQVSTPLVVTSTEARLDNVVGELLRGRLTGRIVLGLESTPKYSLNLAVENSDLAELALTLPGRQEFAGLLSGHISIDGQGADLRTAKGRGDFWIREGDLGKLPVVLRLFQFLNLRPPAKTAFDSAEVNVRLEDGLAYLDPIVLTGDVISLRGGGNMNLQGDLDLRLRILYGRDRWNIPIVSAAMSEAGSQILDLHVTGKASYPRFRSEVLPRATDLFRTFGRAASTPRPTPPTDLPPLPELGSSFGLGRRATASDTRTQDDTRAWWRRLAPR